jgi:glycopeptide antibiotics resistance protein
MENPLRRAVPIAALLLWSAFIMLLVVPWGGFQDHIHWGKVGWIPFVSRPLKLSDIVANVLLYVPLGLGAHRVFGIRAWWAGLALAALLSVGTEATQLYSHRRFPSATDLTSNLLGTIGGLLLASRRAEASARQ